jgi:hypothetical protein
MTILQGNYKNTMEGWSAMPAAWHSWQPPLRNLMVAAQTKLFKLALMLTGTPHHAMST